MSDSSTEAGEQKWYENPLFLFALLGAVGLSTLGYWWLIHRWDADYEKTGQFGDTFGALNAVFTGLAFAGLIFSIMQQRRDLRMQREELALQRQELRLQREEQVSTRGVFERQNFETTFFNMLSLLGEIVDKLDPNSRSNTRGRAVFELVWLDTLNGIGSKTQQEITFPNAVAAYDNKIYPNWEQSIGHYWRVLYNLLKFVNTSSLPENEKFRYAHIVRAQLGRDELILLALNAATARGKKMRTLVIRYGLLKHIPKIPYPAFSVRDHFEKAAFQDANDDSVLVPNP